MQVKRPIDAHGRADDVAAGIGEQMSQTRTPEKQRDSRLVTANRVHMSNPSSSDAIPDLGIIEASLGLLTAGLSAAPSLGLNLLS